MRKLALLTFLTLDGVMQSPGHPGEDPSGGFVHGGWAQGCWDEVMEQVAQATAKTDWCLLKSNTTANGATMSIYNRK